MASVQLKESSRAHGLGHFKEFLCLQTRFSQELYGIHNTSGKYMTKMGHYSILLMEENLVSQAG